LHSLSSLIPSYNHVHFKGTTKSYKLATTKQLFKYFSKPNIRRLILISVSFNEYCDTTPLLGFIRNIQMIILVLPMRWVVLNLRLICNVAEVIPNILLPLKKQFLSFRYQWVSKFYSWSLWYLVWLSRYNSVARSVRMLKKLLLLSNT